MQLSNLESMPGHRIIQQLGLVSGNTVQSKDFIQDAFAGLKNIIGGELTEYTELLEEARNEAMQRMIKKAEKLGANAIVGIRFFNRKYCGSSLRDIGLWYGCKS